MNRFQLKIAISAALVSLSGIVIAFYLFGPAKVGPADKSTDVKPTQQGVRDDRQSQPKAKPRVRRARAKWSRTARNKRPVPQLKEPHQMLSYRNKSDKISVESFKNRPMVDKRISGQYPDNVQNRPPQWCPECNDATNKIPPPYPGKAWDVKKERELHFKIPE